ncbi:hypothetical protein DFJ77DRAFT_515508 [Powellomyces hirtus]|nr:hypothetical protein DFJ77DRAFT_515723 [Powellomyces hirtus]KAI8904220.1 hypothetical protein DFJ77DRAFT_515508 [Powellomyces hirtus]
MGSFAKKPARDSSPKQPHLWSHLFSLLFLSSCISFWKNGCFSAATNRCLASSTSYNMIFTFSGKPQTRWELFRSGASKVRQFSVLLVFTVVFTLGNLNTQAITNMNRPHAEMFQGYTFTFAIRPHSNLAVGATQGLMMGFLQSGYFTLHRSNEIYVVNPISLAGETVAIGRYKGMTSGEEDIWV